MKYLVIGLGNLGRAIAESLTRIGNDTPSSYRESLKFQEKSIFRN